MIDVFLLQTSHTDSMDVNCRHVQFHCCCFGLNILWWNRPRLC